MKILIFYANAGHGHKQVAQVIADAIKKKEGDADSKIILRDALDFTPYFFRKSYPAVYQFAVKTIPKIWGWFYETLDHLAFYRIVHPLRSLHNRIMAGKLLSFAMQEKPDAIICTHFLSSELFATAKSKGLLKAKIITVVTDFLPHTFWVTRGMDLYWTMSEEGSRDLQRRGVDASKIEPRGIPVAEMFQPRGMRQEILTQWGFKNDRLTLLMTSGSFGLGPQEEMLNALAPLKDRIQCFVVCGNNAILQKKLEEKSFSFPVKIFGFIHFMADLMEASDLVIAKSGGSTTTETLTKGVPMVVIDPIPGQETRNAEVLKSRKAAFFIRSPGQIRTIVESILEYPSVLAEKKAEIRRFAKPRAAQDLADCLLSSR